MATIPELQDLLNAKKSVAALLTERIATNQAIKDQYAPRIKFAQELGQDLDPIVLKLQSLNYTDPAILASGLEKVNYTINNIINQIIISFNCDNFDYDITYTCIYELFDDIK